MGKCILLTSRIVQVDVTSKTEGKAFADATGVPLLVKYDTRLRDNVAKNIVQDVTSQVQVSIWMHALPASEGRACVRTVLLLSSLYCEHCEITHHLAASNTALCVEHCHHQGSGVWGESERAGV